MFQREKSWEKRRFAPTKGNFLGHASGGELDINLFPNGRTEPGWSDEGKQFRQMERYVADHPGHFSIIGRLRRRYLVRMGWIWRA